MLECVTLIIGVGEYQHMAKVRVAGHEAQMVYWAVLEHLKPNVKPILRYDRPGKGTADQDKCLVGKADWSSLSEAFKLFQMELRARRGKCVAFFYYSGHGKWFEKGHYLLANDSTGTTADSHCFEENVLEPMRECAVVGLAVLNCCRTLGFETDESAGPIRDCGPAPRRGSAYVCWAADLLRAAPIQSGFTSKLVTYLFRSDMSVLKATSLVLTHVEEVGRQHPVCNMHGDMEEALNTPLVQWKNLDKGASSVPGAGGSAAEAAQNLTRTNISVGDAAAASTSVTATITSQPGHTRLMTPGTCSPDGRKLASGSNDKSIRVWDATSGAGVATLQGHTRLMTPGTCSPDGRKLASGSNDESIRVWDATSGAGVATLQGHSHLVTSVTWSPNGRKLASGSNDKSIRVWDADSGACVATLQGHETYLRSVAWSPDGRKLASGSDDRSIRVWDATRGACLATLQGHEDWVWSVAWSPDGRKLASGSNDKSIRVWDATSGACAASL